MMKKLSASSKNKINTVVTVAIAGTVVGILFANLAFGFTFYRVIKGALIGLLITSISSSAEIFFFQKKLNKLNFSFELFIRSVFYVLLISFSTLVVVIIHESLEDEVSLIDAAFGNDVSEFLKTDFTYIFAFAIAVSLSINFIWQINRMLGKGVLLNVIIGRYRRPATENKIFMFLDLKSSTTLAEKLNPYLYSKLLQEFFNDITDPVIMCNGDIYQYVGDEVVLMWAKEKGLNENNCLNCFFLIKGKIKQRESYYLKEFELVPEFKAGMHIGDAVVTEVGELKKEIVYHGDVLNTASRIQSECNRLDSSLLISRELFSELKNTNDYSFKSEGKILLKGKENEVELLSVISLGNSFAL